MPQNGNKIQLSEEEEIAVCPVGVYTMPIAYS